MDLSKLTTSLRSKCGLQTVEVNNTERQIRILGRLANNRMGDWLLLMHHVFIFIADRKPEWTVDISKSYFLNQRKIVFGWRLIFQGPKIMEFIPEILNVMESAPQSARREVMEIPLLGVSPDRNAPVRGRGAGHTDKHAVGPLALSSLNQNR